MSKLLGRAIALAAKAHEHDVDKGGKAYILHPIRIMMRLRTSDDHLNICAILHDVIEDHPEFLEEIDKLELPVDMYNTLECLTHQRGESYDDYIDRLCTSRQAMIIKKKDLEDNSCLTRIKGVRSKDLDRVVKYNKAYVYINEKLKECDYV